MPPLGQDGRLKLHSLQSVWPSRRLPEGEDDGEEGRYCADPCLDGRIRALHRLALQGVPDIQPHIDAFLPAVAFLLQNPERTREARRMVCGVPDASQLGRLPDLGAAIRLLLVAPDTAHTACGWCCAHFLCKALPCIRPGRTPPPADAQHQVAICVLLGLYPNAIRFPPFPVRVALYRRVHCLLTHPGSGRRFCERFPAVVTLAFMEYCAWAAPALMPAEAQVLAREQGMSGFFAGCGVLCDTFRQECLLTGEESWDALERHCAPVVDRHARACKGRGRARAQEIHGGRGTSTAMLLLPYVVPYDVHTQDATRRILRSEMACLGLLTEEECEQAMLVQGCVYIHALPENVRKMQLRALAGHLARCERSAMSGMLLYVCTACVASGQATGKKKASQTRGQCKLDVEGDRLVCSCCQSEAVVSVSTLGRIVTIRQSRYYLAPCCNSVQLYTGRGDEFNEQANERCAHAQGRPPARAQKRRCELCSNVALVEGLSAVDHLTGEMRTVFLCQRHTPHQDALRQVANWRQLEAEVRKRDRPLFRAEK